MKSFNYNFLNPLTLYENHMEQDVVIKKLSYADVEQPGSVSMFCSYYFKNS